MRLLYIGLLLVYSIGLMSAVNAVEGSKKPEVYCLEWR